MTNLKQLTPSQNQTTLVQDRQVMASLPPSVSSRLIELWDGDWNVVGYELEPGADQDDINLAIDLIQVISQPADRKTIIQELTRLHVSTKQRSQEASDTAMQLQVYAEALAEYPADAVIDALRKWHKTHNGQWWPSLKELTDEIDWRNNRAKMIAELQRHNDDNEPLKLITNSIKRI